MEWNLCCILLSIAADIGEKISAVVSGFKVSLLLVAIAVAASHINWIPLLIAGTVHQRYWGCCGSIPSPYMSSEPFCVKHHGFDCIYTYASLMHHQERALPRSTFAQHIRVTGRAYWNLSSDSSLVSVII